MTEYKHVVIDEEECGGGVGIVTVVVLLDSTILNGKIVEAVGNELLCIAGNEKRERIAIDFSNVDHMGIAMLGKLWLLRKLTTQLRLFMVNPQAYEVFKRTHLDRMFMILRTRKEAIESFCNT